VGESKDGETLLRVRYISLDAANRAWMHGATYRAAVELNSVMAGGGVAEVVLSKAAGFAPGEPGRRPGEIQSHGARLPLRFNLIFDDSRRLQWRKP
jgi:N-terminal domain of oxidoreductase